MEALEFADIRCGAMIADAARTMAASRTVTLRCQPGVAARFGMLSVADVAGVRLVTADGR